MLSARSSFGRMNCVLIFGLAGKLILQVLPDLALVGLNVLFGVGVL